MGLLFIERVREDKAVLTEAVKTVSLDIGIPANWLMLYMRMESNLNPHAANPNSTAYGAIQFMESTREWLGVTKEELSKMTLAQQVYGPVRDYMMRTKRARGSFDNIEDGYLAILYPAAVGKPDDYVLPDWVYRSNKVLDYNKDGQLSKGEFRDKLLSLVPANRRNELKKKYNNSAKQLGDNDVNSCSSNRGVLADNTDKPKVLANNKNWLLYIINPMHWDVVKLMLKNNNHGE